MNETNGHSVEEDLPLKEGQQNQAARSDTPDDVIAYQEKRYTTIKYLHLGAFIFFLIQTIIYSVIHPSVKVYVSLKMLLSLDTAWLLVVVLPFLFFVVGLYRRRCFFFELIANNITTRPFKQVNPAVGFATPVEGPIGEANLKLLGETNPSKSNAYYYLSIL
jgi:hypothetical protein